MSKRQKPFDPLQFIPSADAIRSKLSETETLAQRLRVLLDLAEKLNLPLKTGTTALSAITEETNLQVSNTQNQDEAT